MIRRYCNDRGPFALFVCVLVSLAACGDVAEEETNSPATGETISETNGETSAVEGCVPSREQWDRVVRSIVEDDCGQCHGETIDYGAPYSLLDYDALMEGDMGARKVDRILDEMRANTMPPAWMPRMEHAAFDTLVLWSSCGEEHPDYAAGLDATAPVFLAPPEPPQGMESFDFVAPNFEVAPDTLDLYQCFTFEAPVGEDRFIRRIEAIVDESRVLHHVVLLRDTGNEAPLEPHTCYGMPPQSDYLYAWAPGGGPVQFPEGGLRVRPGERFVVQIHYNNGAGIEDARDNSGIRLYHAPPEGTEYGMFAPGPLDFSIPAGETKEVVGECTVPNDMTIIAGMPHMHEIGDAFEQSVLSGGEEELLIALTGWSFEMQLFYHTPMELKQGDILRTTCMFNNTTDRRVRSGEGTGDEMCFNFMYVTPPPNGRYCDAVGGDSGAFVYEPGTCAVEEERIDVGVASSRVLEGVPEDPLGGPLADGDWELVEVEFWFDEFNTPLGVLDPDATSVEASGQFHAREGAFWFDVDARFTLTSEAGLAFSDEFAFTFGGDLDVDNDAGLLNVEYSCGRSGQGQVPYEMRDGQLRVPFRANEDSVKTTLVFIFENRSL